ncbi:hypothetical protein HNR00_001343 [Methylorubrum rhodinum]|uniref:Uncharacterized protein n=1 Tax=Methylorubrum rhodinum TaxID=29428 RepID=A0A840ZIF8_9HYPH|nr:hypothetical protein [Methylorubrum rhodinum]MBB5756643.1 hypothetical protein [Methylorubrum rhodinum]
MRLLRLFILAFGMLGGLAGLNATAQAAPLPVSPITGQSAEAPLVAKAYYYGYRRHYWRPRVYYRPVYWRPRHYYRRHYWRPRPYYRRHYWRPRPYWHRRHHWHRRHFWHRRFY